MKNQLLDFDQFLSEVGMVVIMVKHDHIKQNWDNLKGKVVLDCHNICPLDGVYHISNVDAFEKDPEDFVNAK